MTKPAPPPAAPAKPAANPALSFVPESIPFEDIVDGDLPLTTPAPKVDPAPPAPPESSVALDGDFDIDKQVGLPAPEAPPAPAPKPKDKMRQELEKLAAEKKKADEELASRQKTLAEREAEYTKVQAQLQEREKELNEIKSRSFVGNPAEHPDIRAIADPWNSAATQFADDVEAMGGEAAEPLYEAIKTFSRTLADVEPGTPEYKEAMAKVREEMGPLVGQENLMTGIRMVREGASKILEIRGLMAEIKNDLPTFQYRQQAAAYQSALSDYQEIERGLFNPADDVKLRDPMNHSVVMRAMIDGSEDIAKAAEQCKAFARFVLLPPTPIPPEELAEKPENERAQLMTAHYERYNKATKKLRGVLAEALLARQVVPGLFKRIEELEAMVGGERRIVRPRLSGEAPPPAAGDGEEADIRRFEPSNQELEDFKKSA